MIVHGAPLALAKPVYCDHVYSSVLTMRYAIPKTTPASELDIGQRSFEKKAQIPDLARPDGHECGKQRQTQSGQAAILVSASL